MRAFRPFLDTAVRLVKRSFYPQQFSPSGVGILQRSNKHPLKEIFIVERLANAQELQHGAKVLTKSFHLTCVYLHVDNSSLLLASLSKTKLDMSIYNSALLTMGVPLKIQRRSASRAQTAFAILVLGFLIWWPSSRITR